MDRTYMSVIVLTRGVHYHWNTKLHQMVMDEFIMLKNISFNKSVFVNLRGFSVILKITKKSYFLTLSPAFLGPEGP